MSYQNPTFRGDNLYKIECTGNCVRGDEVKFERAVFTGSFRNAKFSHFEVVEGQIINDSYGADKQQHTFTIQSVTGERILIKGRNLYKNGTWRKPWPDEKKRLEVAEEKYSRGNVARQKRATRKAGNIYEESMLNEWGYRQRQNYYNNEPRMIEVKYPTTCRETGKPLKKGDKALYFPKDKTLYHPDSKNATQWRMDMEDEKFFAPNYFGGNGGYYR